MNDIGHDVKLIWHADNLSEVDWLHDMFGSLIDSEIVDIDLTCFDDNSIHVVSSNWFPLPKYEAYFKECRARCKKIALFHASDEWFSGGYRLYQYFDLIIRNFHTYLADNDGILTLPEGYSNGTKVSGTIIPADQRQYAWSFTGQLKASRFEMAAAFDGFEPQLLTPTASQSAAAGKKLSKAEFDAVLETTVFSPCPMGNVILETWRFYESLELGCIPLIEARVSLDYFGNLLGRNPIPVFHNWTDARRYAEAAFKDKNGLNGKQLEIRDWWTAHKAKVRLEFHEAINGPSHAETLRRFSDLPRNRFPLMHEPLRLLELLRHQSGGSLLNRLARPAAPLKRIMRESFRGSR